MSPVLAENLVFSETAIIAAMVPPSAIPLGPTDRWGNPLCSELHDRVDDRARVHIKH
mgnify:CR=1 FL=1